MLSNSRYIANASPRMTPAYRVNQNHRFKLAPATIAAPTVTRLANVMSPIQGFGKPKVLAGSETITLPQFKTGFRLQLGTKEGFSRIFSLSYDKTNDAMRPITPPMISMKGMIR